MFNVGFSDEYMINQHMVRLQPTTGYDIHYSLIVTNIEYFRTQNIVAMQIAHEISCCATRFGVDLE